MEFKRYVPIFEQKSKKDKSTWRQFYKRIGKKATEGLKEQTKGTNLEYMAGCFLNAVYMEANWYNNQCPYFKLWPHILDKIKTLDLKIPVSSFRVPFHTFAIFLPKDYVANTLNCKTFNNILFSLDSEMALITGQHDDETPYMFTVPLEYPTLEECFDKEVAEVDNKDLPYDVSKFIFTTCICTSYFGIDAHEIMLPDLPRKYRDKYIKAKKEGKESDVERMLKKARKMGLFGWKMGSEIDLPRPTINYIYLDSKTDKNDTEKRELMYRHMRRGHIRAQACGEGMKDRVPIFIKPKMVRPDLPENPYVRGYRIGRKK